MPRFILSILFILSSFRAGSFSLRVSASARADRPVRWSAGLEILLGLWTVATAWLIPHINALCLDFIGLEPSPLRQGLVTFALPFHAPLRGKVQAVADCWCPCSNAGRWISRDSSRPIPPRPIWWNARTPLPRRAFEISNLKPQISKAGGELSAAIDLYLESTRTSLYFTPAYARCVSIVSVMARTNPAEARRLRQRLEAAQPAQPLGRQVLEPLLGPLPDSRGP